MERNISNQNTELYERPCMPSRGYPKAKLAPKKVSLNIKASEKKQGPAERPDFRGALGRPGHSLSLAAKRPAGVGAPGGAGDGPPPLYHAHRGC